MSARYWGQLEGARKALQKSSWKLERPANTLFVFSYHIGANILRCVLMRKPEARLWKGSMMQESHEAKKRMMEYLRCLGKPKPSDFIQAVKSGTLTQTDFEYWSKKLGRSFVEKMIQLVNPNLSVGDV